MFTGQELNNLLYFITKDGYTIEASHSTQHAWLVQKLKDLISKEEKPETSETKKKEKTKKDNGTSA